MADVNGINSSTGPGAVQPLRTPVRPAASAKASDTVEISLAARLAMKVRELPDVRQDVVQRVKTEIADGTYETPERIDATVERLMNELTGEA